MNFKTHLGTVDFSGRVSAPLGGCAAEWLCLLLTGVNTTAALVTADIPFT
jgi:hypothetical protein